MTRKLLIKPKSVPGHRNSRPAPKRAAVAKSNSSDAAALFVLTNTPGLACDIDELATWLGKLDVVYAGALMSFPQECGRIERICAIYALKGISRFLAVTPSEVLNMLLSSLRGVDSGEPGRHVRTALSSTKTARRSGGG